MKRERTTWLFVCVLLGVLVFQVPGSMAGRDSDFAFVRTLVDIYRQVAVNYVDPVDEKALQEQAIKGMLGELDPYTMYIPPSDQQAFDDLLEGSFRGVGIRLNQLDDGSIEVVTPIQGSPAWDAGVLPGDRLLTVDGQAVTNQRLDTIVPKITGPDGTSVTLGVRHPSGREADITLKRSSFPIPMVKGVDRKADQAWNYWITRQPRIGYVRLAQFTGGTAAQIRQIAENLQKQGMAGMILDLRFNPGGLLEEAVQLVDLFVKDGTIVTTRGRNRPEIKVLAHAQGTLGDFPLVVLVNEHSASAAEVVSGSLKDNARAKIVGVRTYGKGSVQETHELDGNRGELKMTVAYYYLPSGRLVHKVKGATDWGVLPTINVPMDPDQQLRLLQEQLANESMVYAATAPATTQMQTPAGPATTQTTQPVDPQLDAAVELLKQEIAQKGTAG